MNRHILIVEDNPIASKVQKMIVEGLGFTVDSAMTGEEGIDFARAKKYVLILMDLGLPGIDGIETTIQIKTDQSEMNNVLTPIVAVTANEDPVIREQCLAAGMNDVLTKPFTLVTARALISRFCPEAAV